MSFVAWASNFLDSVDSSAEQKVKELSANNALNTLNTFYQSTRIAGSSNDNNGDPSALQISKSIDGQSSIKPSPIKTNTKQTITTQPSASIGVSPSSSPSPSPSPSPSVASIKKSRGQNKIVISKEVSSQEKNEIDFFQNFDKPQNQSSSSVNGVNDLDDSTNNPTPTSTLTDFSNLTTPSLTNSSPAKSIKKQIDNQTSIDPSKSLSSIQSITLKPNPKSNLNQQSSSVAHSQDQDDHQDQSEGQGHLNNLAPLALQNELIIPDPDSNEMDSNESEATTRSISISISHPSTKPQTSLNPSNQIADNQTPTQTQSESEKIENVNQTVSRSETVDKSKSSQGPQSSPSSANTNALADAPKVNDKEKKSTNKTKTIHTTDNTYNENSNSNNSSNNSNLCNNTQHSSLLSEITNLKRTISDLSEENSSLRSVWNDTRQQLDKAKSIFIKKENTFATRLAEMENNFQVKLKEANKENELKITQLNKMHQKTLDEANQQIKYKEDQNQNSSVEVEEMAALNDELHDQIESLNQRISELGRENETLHKNCEELVTNHSMVLKALREEFEKREKSILMEQNIILGQNNKSSDSNEMAELNHHKLEYVQELAKAQKALSEKSRECDRLLSEKRWMDADNGSLTNQINILKQRLEAADKMMNDLQNQLNNQLNEFTKESENFQKTIESKNNTIKDLQYKLNTINSSNEDNRNNNNNQSNGFDSTVENRIKNLADKLLEKSGENEKLTSEKISLRLQLDNERDRIKILENIIQQDQIRKQREEQGILDDPELGLNQEDNKMRLRTRAVNQLGSIGRVAPVARAYSLLDSMGQQTSFLLRRYPSVRLIAMIYVLILHLWIIFVMHHFMATNHAGNLKPQTQNGFNGRPPI